MKGHNRSGTAGKTGAQDGHIAGARGGRHRRRRAWSGILRVPSACCGRAACPISPEWVIPSCPATRRRRGDPGNNGFAEGDLVFVPGANCYKDVKGLFGGAAARIVLPAARAVKLEGITDESSASSSHSPPPRIMRWWARCGCLPQLVVGHGLLGRLIARVTMALGGEGADRVGNPGRAPRRCRRLHRWSRRSRTQRRDYATICDASGAAGLLDTLIPQAGQARRDHARGLLRGRHCPSPSRPPSCARRASASRRNSPWQTCRP